MPHPLTASYLETCRDVAKEFKRNQRLHGRRIHCGRGCTDCCHHVFHITEIEAAHISSRVKQLPASARERLAARAKAYLPARAVLMEKYGFLQAWGNLPAEEVRLACPALEDGTCTIYDQRPRICRQYGMPLFHPQHPSRVFACELNFQRGEHFEDSALIQTQTSAAAKWTSLQERYSESGGRRHDLPVSVADAILEDFEKYLPDDRSAEGRAQCTE